MNLTAEGMALMQFKGWLPETYFKNVAKRNGRFFR